MERLGQFTKFIAKEPSLPIDIATSVLAHRKRTFSKDCNRLAAKFEKPAVLGTENIPINPKPVIVASNHPNKFDLIVGTINITKEFAKRREECELPENIRWMIAQNLISRDSKNIFDQKIIYPTINRILKRIHQTYDFIPVPINYLNTKNQRKERATTLFEARDHLRENPYSAVGVFPEGDFGPNDEILDFYGGIGTLCRAIKTELLVLPTAIYRDTKDNLTISFGQTFDIDPRLDAKEITQSVKNSIETLKI